mgnify:CR=1 FL=1
MGSFVKLEQDGFNPEFGGVIWRRRLNQRLEEREVEIEPVGYREGDKPVMQVTQENTVIYINQVADELDCLAIRYDQDADDLYTWYFRHRFESDDAFAHVVHVVGTWATVMTTLYPMEHVVKQYEAFMDSEIPDEVPDDMV